MGVPTVVSLFAGCGGSTLGYRWARYRELLAVDFDKNSVKTFGLNFPDIPIWREDIIQIKGDKILKFCGVDKGELDLLDGSPPCQGFSTAGKRRVMDKRNDLVLHYIRLVDEIRPKVFIMENVPGMVKGRMKGLFKEYTKRMKDMGYKVRCKLLNSMHYGVPQFRERLFWVGVRGDIGKEPQFPKPNNNAITVKKALAGCPKDNDILRPKGKAYWLALKMKEGIKGSDITGGPFFSLIRLRWDRPSPTITKTIRASQAGLLHPTENRYLTISELKRIASFPDNFVFVGRFEEKWARIGNAVMPKQMFAIAKTIKEKILF